MKKHMQRQKDRGRQAQKARQTKAKDQTQKDKRPATRVWFFRGHVRRSLRERGGFWKEEDKGTRTSKTTQDHKHRTYIYYHRPWLGGWGLFFVAFVLVGVWSRNCLLSYLVVFIVAVPLPIFVLAFSIAIDRLCPVLVLTFVIASMVFRPSFVSLDERYEFFFLSWIFCLPLILVPSFVFVLSCLIYVLAIATAPPPSPGCAYVLSLSLSLALVLSVSWIVTPHLSCHCLCITWWRRSSSIAFTNSSQTALRNDGWTEILIIRTTNVTVTITIDDR